jgi:hypothetical protein
MRGLWGISKHVGVSTDATKVSCHDATSFIHYILFQLTRMFKPSTKHNIQAGPSSGYAEVKLNGKTGIGNGNGQVSGRYPYRLNL